MCAHTFLLILVSVAYLPRANLDTCMHALVPFEAYPAITTHARVCDRTDIQQDATDIQQDANTYPACIMYVWECCTRESVCARTDAVVVLSHVTHEATHGSGCREPQGTRSAAKSLRHHPCSAYSGKPSTCYRT